MSNRQHSNTALLKRWPTNYAINITRHTHNTCITTADHIGIREEVQKRNQVPERCVRHVFNHFHSTALTPLKLLSESSRSSYASGGYFVGVLPIRC